MEEREIIKYEDNFKNITKKIVKILLKSAKYCLLHKANVV